MAKHSEASLGARHPIHNYEYADAAARLAASGFVTGDIGKVALQLSNDTFHILTDTSPIWTEITGSGGGGGSDWVEDEFTPSNGQVTFILSQAPTDAETVFFIVNGQVIEDDNYIRSGVTITWLNTVFVMETTDAVVVKYK